MKVQLTHNGIVTSINKLKEDYILLSVRIDSRPVFVPGQFMMMQVSDSYDPLLLRPFSILDEDKGVYRFLIKIAGRGTRAIAGFKYGKSVFLTGPFGNGFPSDVKSGPLVAAGGVGIASVFAFVQMLDSKGIPYEFLYGARTEDELVLLDLVKPYHPLLSTDDGSKGYHGKLTDLLKRKVRHNSTVFACGPMPMLAVVKDITMKNHAACYLSLEARMACGFGACLGCTIFDAKGSTRRVCKEGPVFDAEEVNLTDIH